MERETFMVLFDGLILYGGLENGYILSAGKKVLIFVSTCHPNTNRKLADRLEHSGSTISLVLREVINRQQNKLQDTTFLSILAILWIHRYSLSLLFAFACISTH